MKKRIFSILAIIAACSLSACNNNATPAETLTGRGEGYGGEIVVSLTMQDGKIADVAIQGDNETEGIGTLAIEQLPEKIIAANSADVDVITGATYTSNGILYAVNNALNPDAFPYPIEATEQTPDEIQASAAYLGFGIDNSVRIRESGDEVIYSTNQIIANALFDEDGKILALFVDQLEIYSGNYDSDSPSFSGFPGQGGFGEDVTEEQLLAEPLTWATKRERGSDYKLNSGTWAEEMDAYQNIFIGMTVTEVEEWFNKYCSDVNGRPLQAESDNEEDVEKYNALSEQDQAMLADVVTSATMSLNDNHGNIIGAIKNAYDNRVPFTGESAKGLGIGMYSTGRLGPGSDEDGVPVYGVNQVFVNSVFDENDKIVGLYIDQIEFLTPNYEGEFASHFSGYPGQEGYNYDENHDGELTVLVPTNETFANDIANWTTKRGFGDNYRTGAGSWASQMDTFQNIFIGMTVTEVEEWFEKYCSDINGRPLKADSNNDEDVEKFNALSEEEQAMLADVVSSATISLNDSHGDIIAAIVKSLQIRSNIDVNIQS